jgi:hypothetical protein
MCFTILNNAFLPLPTNICINFCHSKGMFLCCLVGFHAMTRITELDQMLYNESIARNILHFQYRNVFFLIFTLSPSIF